MGNAPNLQRLVLGGVHNIESGTAIASISESIGTSKHLIELSVKNTYMTKDLLETLVRSCPESVRDLRLWNIALLDGDWGSVFQLMKDKKTFKPKTISFVNLSQRLPIAATVAFEGVNHMRPLVWDDAVLDDGPLPGKVGWDRLSTREKELKQLDCELHESFVWVDLRVDLRVSRWSRIFQLELDADDCEYLEYWLHQVIESHTLKMIE